MGMIIGDMVMKKWIISKLALMFGYDVYLFKHKEIIKQIKDECLWSSDSAEKALSTLKNKGILAFADEVYHIPN